jgi:hypothetical protein
LLRPRERFLLFWFGLIVSYQSLGQKHAMALAISTPTSRSGAIARRNGSNLTSA